MYGDKDPLADDLQSIRGGLGMHDPDKWRRVTIDLCDELTRLTGANCHELARRVAVGPAVLSSLIEALKEPLQQVARAEFNHETPHTGALLGDRQRALAADIFISAKTVGRRGDKVIQILTAALRSGEDDSFAGLGLIATPIPASSIRRQAREMIAATEAWGEVYRNTDGGFPYDDGGSGSCTWATAGLTWALIDRRRSDADWIHKTVRWFLGQRNEDRGLGINERGDHSVTDSTAQALLATCTAYALDGDDYYKQALTDLVRWLLGARNNAGGWPWCPARESSDWTASSCFALMALQAASPFLDAGMATKTTRTLASGVDWLLSNDCDGWGNRPGQQVRPAISGLVAYTLTRLDVQPVRLRPVAEDLMNYQFTDAVPDTLDRPAGSTVIRLGEPYYHAGLASVGDRSAERHLRRSFQRLRSHFVTDHFEYLDGASHTWPTRDCLLALRCLERWLDRYGEAHGG